MRTMRDICDGKVSTAVKMMCRGLRNSQTRDDFVVNMDTFGTIGSHKALNGREGSLEDEAATLLSFKSPEVVPAVLTSNDNETLCFGCAATCTVLELQGWSSRSLLGLGGNAARSTSSALGASYNDVLRFESAIDDFRLGSPRELFDYFEVLEIPPGFFATIEEYADDKGVDVTSIDFDPLDCDLFDGSPAPWSLGSDDWLEQLPQIEAYADRLAAAGY
jgi:hypothetical protein